MTKPENLIAYAAGAAIVGTLIYVYLRGAGGVAQDASRAVVNVAGGAATGAVKGVSDTLGIPDTDAAKCKLAISQGDSWNASLYCPALDFARYFLSSGGNK